MEISYTARQRLRQVMQNIEKADEIIDALDLFLDRFTVIKGNFYVSLKWANHIQ